MLILQKIAVESSSRIKTTQKHVGVNRIRWCTSTYTYNVNTQNFQHFFVRFLLFVRICASGKENDRNWRWKHIDTTHSNARSPLRTHGKNGGRRIFFAICWNIEWLKIHMFGISQTSKSRIRWREATEKNIGRFVHLCQFVRDFFFSFSFHSFALYFSFAQAHAHKHKHMHVGAHKLRLTCVQVAKESFEKAILGVRNRWVLLLCFLILSRSRPKSWFISCLHNDHCFSGIRTILFNDSTYTMCTASIVCVFISFSISFFAFRCLPFSRDVVKLQIIKLH